MTMIREPASLANSMADNPIGPAPMTSTVSSGFGFDAVDRVQADAERFHEGELLEGQFRGDVQFASGNGEERAEAAIDVHAEGFVVLATIGVPARAGIAVLAIDVGLDGGTVAGT